MHSFVLGFVTLCVAKTLELHTHVLHIGFIAYTITDKEALAQDHNYLPVPSQVHFPGDMTAMQIECGTFHTGMYIRLTV